ncbi:hypothetical protein [Kitasatospora sp. HPMI-4]|uniref:hypothetical protein n=1 Tax=Kitasatospora sp. HPMI-4 TaxID=3448443 RepID=UPI003F1D3283
MTHDGHHGQGDAAQELKDLEAAWELTPARWRCAHCGDRITGEVPRFHIDRDDCRAAGDWPPMNAPEAGQEQPASAPATAADEPSQQPTGRDWREELETTRLARLAVARLRRDLAADVAPQLPPGPELAALVEEFDRMRTALAASWRHAADLLEATPHHPTALTGPYWYGQGWDEAVDHLRFLADGMD